jgi:hypothetical protein
VGTKRGGTLNGFGVAKVVLMALQEGLAGMSTAGPSH